MATSLLVCAVALLVMAEAEVENCDTSAEELMRTELLQSTAVLSQAQARTHTHTASTALNDDTQLQPRQRTFLEVPKPIVWVHITKCNSGFARSLLFLPGMCQNMSDLVRGKLMDEDLMDKPPIGQLREIGTDMEDECRGDVPDFRDLGVYWGDHSGLDATYHFNKVQGHGFILLRQPEQRLISAWNNWYHDWPSKDFGRIPNNMIEFASVLQGCQTKVLTRSQVSNGLHNYPFPCGDPESVTEEETKEAISRLRNGMAFVGTLERFDLSVCLLHAMFGGKCTSLELGASHGNVSVYDTSELHGWHDVYDGALYAEADAILDENLALYGVTDASCQPCWAQAGLA